MKIKKQLLYLILLCFIVASLIQSNSVVSKYIDSIDENYHLFVCIFFSITGIFILNFLLPFLVNKLFLKFSIFKKKYNK